MAVQFSIESWSSVMASSLPNHHFHNFSRTFPPLHLSNGLQFFIIKRVFGILAACMAMISASTNNAWAHQGQSHHEGLINNHIHAGHFGDAHFHHHPGAVILAPPLLSYYPQSAYHSEITVIQATPTAFIEQGTDGMNYSYWYYCPNPPGYYPQVQQCLSGWQKVPLEPSW
jgi:hypothetical protein